MQEIILSLKNISKSFSNTVILNNVSIDIFKGEFITLLGPSGCGKTTLLRIIAGLEKVDDGQIVVNGKDITFTEAYDRNVNTVFQNYALFPHMNVYDNIAYGLKIKKVRKEEIRKKISDMLALVNLEGESYTKRMPHQLSGGQKQRISIIRALINNPDIVLLDEPLGALDLKLRQHMQSELKRIQRQTGTTFIYVTHDQDEALNMSDRIAVMRGGSFQQIGKPEEIYNQPRTEFVAQFVGNRNLFEAKLIKNIDDQTTLVSIFGKEKAVSSNPCTSSDILVAVHFDKITVSLSQNIDIVQWEGIVEETFYTGVFVKTNIRLFNNFLVEAVSYHKGSSIQLGQKVFISFDKEEGVIVERSKEI